MVRLGEDAIVALVMQLQAQVQMLSEQVAVLQRQVNANSQNSSKPPSSDGYQKPPPKSLRTKSGRRSGGQKGHPGTTLQMTAEPDHVTEHWPQRCGGCGRRLAQGSSRDYEARQVHDLPPLKIEVHEHRGMQVCCTGCGKVTRGAFPDAVKPGVQYGPGLVGLAVYLQTYQLLPLERTQEMLRDLFGSGMSEGTLENMRVRCVEKLVPITERIKAAIAGSAVVNFDETGMRVKGGLWWLHSASTDTLTSYAADPKRGCDAMNRINILPHFSGIAVHDAFSSYGKYGGRHALCNAHLLRELTGLSEMLPNNGWLTRLKVLLLKMKEEVDAAKGRGETELVPKRRAKLEDRYSGLLNQGILFNTRPVRQPGQRGRPRASPARNLAERMRDHKDSVLRFLRDFQVPFDNNQAERDLRMMKVKQKISGCFRSESGAHGFAAIRGYVSTLRKQGFPVLAALRALFEGRPVDLRLA